MRRCLWSAVIAMLAAAVVPFGLTTPALGSTDGWSTYGQLLYDSDLDAPGLEPAARTGHAAALGSNGYLYALGGEDPRWYGPQLSRHEAAAET
jgi:hypothetical protein